MGFKSYPKSMSQVGTYDVRSFLAISDVALFCNDIEERTFGLPEEGRSAARDTARAEKIELIRNTKESNMIPNEKQVRHLAACLL